MSALLASAPARAGWLIADPASGCTMDDAYPIAGSSGLENALSALRINAQTYSATRFAEREVFPYWEDTLDAISEGDREGFGRAAFEYNTNFGVAEVPIWFTNADCPDAYRFSNSPVDLYATNLGGVGGVGRFGFYYAASFTMGTIGLPEPQMRYGLAFPMMLIGLYGSMVAPFSGDGAQVIQGASAWSMEWLGGAVYNGRFLQARAGYTGSTGLHGSLESPQIGLYANGVVRNEGGLTVAQYEAGLGERRWGNATEKIGATSLFARGVPLTEPEDEPAAPDQRAIQLRSGHVEQKNIAERVDLVAAWATAPEPLLHEAWIGIHSPGFGSDEPTEDQWLSTRVGAGMFQMPVQYYYGLEGGPLFTARYDMRISLPETIYEDFQFSLAWNDPEQLVIFPFARNSLSLRLAMTGTF